MPGSLLMGFFWTIWPSHAPKLELYIQYMISLTPQEAQHLQPMVAICIIGSERPYTDHVKERFMRLPPSGCSFRANGLPKCLLGPVVVNTIRRQFGMHQLPTASAAWQKNRTPIWCQVVRFGLIQDMFLSYNSLDSKDVSWHFGDKVIISYSD